MDGGVIDFFSSALLSARSLRHFHRIPFALAGRPAEGEVT